MKLSIKDKFTEREGLIYIYGLITGILILTVLSLGQLENNYAILIFSFILLGISIHHFIRIYFRIKHIKFRDEMELKYLIIIITFAPIIMYILVFILTIIKLIKPYLV